MIVACCALVVFVVFTVGRDLYPSSECGVWQRAREQHAEEVRIWEIERAEHQREREVFDQERAQWEQERRAHKPFWGQTELESPACLAYNTRRYKARLWNIPLGGDWLKACMSTPIEIRGHTFSAPEHCNSDVGLSLWCFH